MKEISGSICERAHPGPYPIHKLFPASVRDCTMRFHVLRIVPAQVRLNTRRALSSIFNAGLQVIHRRARVLRKELTGVGVSDLKTAAATGT